MFLNLLVAVVEVVVFLRHVPQPVGGSCRGGGIMVLEHACP